MVRGQVLSWKGMYYECQLANGLQSGRLTGSQSSIFSDVEGVTHVSHWEEAFRLTQYSLER